MRTIIKGTEPTSLTQHRSTPGADWDGYAHKDEARKALCKEQGFICAFCTGRIRDTPPASDHHCGTKVAHWHPRRGPDGDPSLQLLWSNLLGCCPGGELGPPRHCDTAQGDVVLTLHPVLGGPAPEVALRYEADGRLYSDDPRIQRDIDLTLNLNCEKLRTRRAAAAQGAFEGLNRKRHWGLSELRDARRRWADRDRDGMLKPFSPFAVARIDRRIAQKEADP